MKPGWAFKIVSLTPIGVMSLASFGRFSLTGFELGIRFADDVGDASPPNDFAVFMPTFGCLERIEYLHFLILAVLLLSRLSKDNLRE